MTKQQTQQQEDPNYEGPGYDEGVQTAPPAASIVARPTNPMTQSAGAQALVQRTLGEVQVAVMMAKQFPRDKILAKEKLQNDCTREGLAKVAMYSYAKGGTKIMGPSIRLAEAIKNAWGNMQSGWRELTRTTVQGVGVSEVEAFAWDTENNTRASITFNVKHWRDTKSGGYPIKEEREIYELCANQAARRERACILKMVDGDMVEMAVDQCAATLRTKVDITPARIANMVKMFEEYDVTKAQIEKRIQCRIEAINAPQMLSLTGVYNSLKDGMSKPEEWFEPEKGANGAAEDKTPKGGNAAAKDKLRKKAKEAGADPDTGEIKEQVAEQNAKAAASGVDEEDSALMPEPPLQTSADAAAAGKALVTALQAAPAPMLMGLFVRSHGPAIVKALQEHGQGILLGKIRSLGIKIAE